MLKNKLTLYIFIALILGVVVGYVYNMQVIEQYNLKINTADANIKAIDTKLINLKDTTVAEFKTLKAQRVVEAKIKKENDGIREEKLTGFTVLSDIFLRLIKMIVAPLVFTTLVVGVAKVGDIKAVGRIGGKTLLWFLSATLVSLLLGMLLVNLFKPGVTMNIPLPDSHLSTEIKKNALSLKDFISHVVPRSFTEAMANNEILQIVIFSMFFGVATAAIGKQGEIVVKAMDAIAHVILKITTYVMKLAPIAVFGAITAVVAKQGLGIISTYAIFIGEFYFSLFLLWAVIIFAGFVVLKTRALDLVGKIKDAMLVAFSTSTSEAAYPRVLIELEKFGCNNKIVSFVLPLGYSFNLDGSMMYMTFASIFLAQAYGVHLSIAQEITMLLVLMITSKGIAGVPRASLVVIAGTVAMFGIPEAGLGLLIGIDPLLDMGRSATNVLGNAMATAVVSKWEGELGPEQILAEDL
ncbi:dicarboxylate/amino acid:cation symporter [Mucilaginibacter myungsuensis]|uniref:Dicarboxylate/amino acid:cation symporter n=1 Tax=Mucilaginibacter myungsuensis TaxID=649104 RepID=A0A929PYT5_9SPHI|nr:dicarboxylate/amino acid:cation symporter [Mucilaginibacter myungsuensis]MBE9663667.1 dicarboxylate/amino acid:cation symporter [Mucilaginibacter myungsuensis]MDN3599009.1 dicarboxylate/amino acid:cation symporter [Mucilaginibacter myungsuensis]